MLQFVQNLMLKNKTFSFLKFPFFFNEDGDDDDFGSEKYTRKLFSTMNNVFNEERRS